MDLFGEEMTFEDLQDGIESLCNQLTEAHKLPPRGIWYEKTLSEAKNQVGLLISYSVFINEPAYPATEDEMKDENRTHIPIATIKRGQAKKKRDQSKEDKESVVVLAPSIFLPQVRIPSDADIVSAVKMKLDSPSLLPFVKEVAEWKLRHYISAASPFGCCDMHVKCSDAKMCLHENRLYSTACAYRRNLEAGRIFYGVNRNV